MVLSQWDIPDGIYQFILGLLTHSNTSNPMMGALIVTAQQFLLQRILFPILCWLHPKPLFSPCEQVSHQKILWASVGPLLTVEACLALQPKAKTSFPRMLRMGSLNNSVLTVFYLFVRFLSYTILMSPPSGSQWDSISQKYHSKTGEQDSEKPVWIR